MRRVATGAVAVCAIVGALASCGAESARHELGGACTSDVQCRVGLVCVGDDPGGQCTKFCTSDVECGAGALCDPEGKCYQACHTTADCPRAAIDPRYGCTGTAPRTFCDALPDTDGGAAD